VGGLRLDGAQEQRAPKYAGQRCGYKFQEPSDDPPVLVDAKENKPDIIAAIRGSATSTICGLSPEFAATQKGNAQVAKRDLSSPFSPTPPIQQTPKQHATA